MKTAISIPDPIFKALSYYVKKKGVSRSKIISDAVEEYIKFHESTDVTEQLNRLYSGDDNSMEKPILKTQVKLLGKAGW